jgi:hypothetical protein
VVIVDGFGTGCVNYLYGALVGVAFDGVLARCVTIYILLASSVLYTLNILISSKTRLTRLDQSIDLAAVRGYSIAYVGQKIPRRSPTALQVFIDGQSR